MPIFCFCNGDGEAATTAALGSKNPVVSSAGDGASIAPEFSPAAAEQLAGDLREPARRSWARISSVESARVAGLRAPSIPPSGGAGTKILPNLWMVQCPEISAS
nr:hypothetical protein Iba_chr15eCG3740 [Ipomoea batatas]